MVNFLYDIVEMNILTRLTPNEKTLQAYNKRLSQYILNTPSWYNESHTPLLQWMRFCLALTPRKAEILEIGSGPGRDALFISSQGFNVTCSDASYEFVDYLNKRGQHALLLDAVKDSIPLGFQMIFANAVIQHFTEDNLDLVLEKVYDALPAGGIFAFSVKQGDGEAWITEKLQEKRYIRYWQPEELLAKIDENGYKVEYLQKNIPGDLPNHIWTLIVVRKMILTGLSPSLYPREVGREEY